MSTYRVPKCGRHFVKFDDVTIYPVLVVARTGYFTMSNILLYFVPETVDWQHSRIPIVVDKFSILTQMSQLQRKPASSSLLTARPVRTNTVN